jgi:two-component system phosphate regulon response regulator PhoB
VTTPNWIKTERMEQVVGSHNGGHHELVLLIENDSAVAEMYAMGLNFSGYEVHIAMSLDSAWSQVNQPGDAPELIVLDLELPSTRGLDVLQDLRQSPSTSQVPVIVLANDQEDFGEAYRRGATDCHAKYRTTPRQLAGYVGAALGGAHRTGSQ